MGFNTEKNKIRKTWDKSLHNNINNLKTITINYDQTKEKIRTINVPLQVIKKFQKSDQEFTLMEEVRTGRIIPPGFAKVSVSFINWKLALGLIDERILPDIQHEIIIKLPGLADPEITTAFFPGFKSFYFEVKDPNVEVGNVFLKDVILHASLRLFNGGFVPFDPGEHEAQLILTIPNTHNYR